MSDELEQPLVAGQRACAFYGRAFAPHAPTMKYCTNLCRHRAGAVRQGTAREGRLSDEPAGGARE